MIVETTRRRKVNLGTIEFHSPSFNPQLVKDFYEIVDDLRESGSIIDVWLMDIATILKRAGYEMTITTKRPLPGREKVEKGL